MVLQVAPKDPVAHMWFMKDAIAQRYGWSFDQIDSLTIEEYVVIQGIISAESRYMKRKELEAKLNSRV